MLILLFFAFVSGLVTILAPCIWPLLPIVLSSTATGGRRKPLGVTLGIMASFTFFTLTLSYIVSVFHFNPNILRLLAVAVIGFLGLTLLLPPLSSRLEGFVSRLSGSLGPARSRSGFSGGFITGFSLGLVWSPCAGPILATIATLAATRSVSIQLVLVTVVYVLGVGIPLFLFASFGSYLFSRTRSVSRFTGRIQQVFGIIMILTALAIFTNYDKIIQVRLLDAIPSYSSFLYKLEGNGEVQKQLDALKGTKEDMLKQMPGDSGLENDGPAPEFTGITRWLNTEKPLTLGDLRGTVVLVDFWTYTCINCIRTLPHVTAWYEKYKSKGFVVIGVHTPEFEFEKDTKNVQDAIKQYRINYPVAQDNTYATWQAYNNHYWPAEYLIDARGNVRRTHFGEGEYEETEAAIQALLKEAGQDVSESVSRIEDQTPRTRLTPETYLGLARMERFVGAATQGTKTYSYESPVPTHEFGLSGTWDLDQEMARPHAGAGLEFHVYAGKVFLVITPQDPAAKIRVLLDGKPASADRQGSDVIGGYVKLDQPRLYNLIDLHGETEDHVLKLQFDTGGISLFAFTFGS